GQRKNRINREYDSIDKPRSPPEHNATEISAQYFPDWHAGNFFARLLCKFRRLQHTQADEEPDSEQQNAEHEGHTPAPGDKIRIARCVGQDRHYASATAQSDREAYLRERGVIGPFLGSSELIGHQHCAPPFAPKCDAL